MKKEVTPDVKADVSEEQAIKPTVSKAKKESIFASLIPLLPVFFHALFIQWTLAFAGSITLGLDWWTSQHDLTVDEEGTATWESQKSSCVMLGLWLATIAVSATAFGASSRAGWICTGASMAVASFAARLMANEDGTSVPSLPIASYSGYHVNVPDLLVATCVFGLVAALKQPVAKQPQEVAAEENQEVVAVVETKEDEVTQNTESDTTQTDEEDDDATVPIAEATGPRSLIGQRVAVEKGIDEFLGTVKDYDAETREWTVHYDNEFQEDEEVNRVQLGSAFKGYSKHLSDNLKSMWRNGEL